PPRRVDPLPIRCDGRALGGVRTRGRAFSLSETTIRKAIGGHRRLFLALVSRGHSSYRIRVSLDSQHLAVFLPIHGEQHAVGAGAYTARLRRLGILAFATLLAFAGLLALGGGAGAAEVPGNLLQARFGRGFERAELSAFDVQDLERDLVR